MRTFNASVACINSFLAGFLLAYGEYGVAAVIGATAVLCAYVALKESA